MKRAKTLKACIKLKLEMTKYAALLVGFIILVAGCLYQPVAFAAKDPNSRFKDIEVRVIRPRYFTKRKHFEVGVQFTSVMNEAFIYTFMATGLVGFHFNEYFAFEGIFGYGQSTDKEAKRVLDDEFDINTRILRTQSVAGGNLVVTPVYGKWQLPGGDLIYFDTFFEAGYGVTGVDVRFEEFCPAPVKDSTKTLPSNKVQNMPTLLLGGGQRYFVSKDSSIRWDLKFHQLAFNEVDVACDPETTVSEPGEQNNITFSIGMSRFF